MLETPTKVGRSEMVLRRAARIAEITPIGDLRCDNGGGRGETGDQDKGEEYGFHGIVPFGED